MKAKNIFLGIAAVLFVSGCVNFGGTTQANVDIANTVSMQPASVSVIPTPPISAGTDFTLTYEIKNQDKAKSVDVDMNLFDWGVCKNPTISCAPKNDPNSKQCQTLNLVPQQTELIEIKATAPSSEEIGGIAATCPIQWRAQYTSSTVSNAGFNVVSRNHLTELQRAGKAVDVPATSSNIGTGPVKAFISFSAAENFVVSKSTIQMKVQVKDLGEGTFTEIPEASLSITVPKEWYLALADEAGDEKAKDACTTKFYPIDAISELRSRADLKTVTFKNKNDNPIPLISKQTPELVCNFKAPDLDNQENPIPQKSYQVSAKIENYVYTLDGKQVVEIKP